MSLEVNSNGALLREHVKSSYSETKKYFISTSAMSMATKFGKVVTYHDGLPHIKSHTFWSRGLLKSRGKLELLYIYC